MIDRPARIGLDRPLRTAIIGASASGGWALESHVPAIQSLDGYELTAVATRSRRSAEAAMDAFGADRGYDDPAELFADADIDLVTIGVRVPAHRELVLAAVAAGKHVLTEWPLGRDVAEAQELRDAAADAGVHAVIGLQARMSAAVQRTRQLIQDGALGRILCARLYDSTVAFGPASPQSDADLEDPANGATHIAIHGGHALDLATVLTGPITPACVLQSTQYPEVAVEGGDTLIRSIPDHLLVFGRTHEGAPLSVEVVGGRPPDDTPFHLEITGTEARIVLVGGAIRGFQSGRLRLRVNGEEQTIEEFPDLPEAAANVAGLYRALREDITTGTTTAPSFDHAVRLTQLIAGIGAPA
ncbi:MAG: Gfo/Idh/MocA family oxidoreductase [Solirubrobacterales bacterium]|nr:Gfo/Idh/MocA family oxidoreductase [Solirubrobacterales bacterium]